MIFLCCCDAIIWAAGCWGRKTGIGVAASAEAPLTRLMAEEFVSSVEVTTEAPPEWDRAMCCGRSMMYFWQMGHRVRERLLLLPLAELLLLLLTTGEMLLLLLSAEVELSGLVRGLTSSACNKTENQSEACGLLKLEAVEVKTEAIFGICGQITLRYDDHGGQN